MRSNWAICLILLCGCRDLAISICDDRPTSPALESLRKLLDNRGDTGVASVQIMRSDRERRGETRRWEAEELSASAREELIARFNECVLPYHIPASSDGTAVEFGIGFFDEKKQLLAAGSGQSQPGVDTIQLHIAVGSGPCERSATELVRQDVPPGGPDVCWLSTEAESDDPPVLASPPLVLPADGAERFEIYGWGFLPRPEVFIDGLSVENVERHGYHRLTVTPQRPPGTLGKVPLRVQNRFAELRSSPSSSSSESLHTQDLAPPRTLCNPADCEERCEVLRVAANHWQFLDGSDFTYAIIDESNVQGELSRQPITLVSGDLNQDGRDDFITANIADNTISILISNKREPAFRQSDAIVHKLPARPSTMALIDLNGDDQLDLIVASERGNSLIALPNLGGARIFGAPVVLRTLEAPINLLVANLDSDMRDDVIVAQAESAAVSVWRNPQLGDWPPPDQVIPLDPDSMPRAMASGELIGDPMLDIAIADISHRQVEILRNLGNGQLQREQGPGLPLKVRSEPISVAIADFNRDRHSDVAVAAYGDTSLSLFLHDGAIAAPQFLPSQPVAVGEAPASILARDLNGDGFVDLGVALDTSSMLALLENVVGNPPLAVAAAVHIRQSLRHTLVSGYYFGSSRTICGQGQLPSIATTNTIPRIGSDSARGTLTVLPNVSY